MEYYADSERIRLLGSFEIDEPEFVEVVACEMDVTADDKAFNFILRRSESALRVSCKPFFYQIAGLRDVDGQVAFTLHLLRHPQRSWHVFTYKKRVVVLLWRRNRLLVIPSACSWHVLCASGHDSIGHVSYVPYNYSCCNLPIKMAHVTFFQYLLSMS